MCICGAPRFVCDRSFYADRSYACNRGSPTPNVHSSWLTSLKSSSSVISRVGIHVLLISSYDLM